MEDISTINFLIKNKIAVMGVDIDRPYEEPSASFILETKGYQVNIMSIMEPFSLTYLVNCPMTLSNTAFEGWSIDLMGKVNSIEEAEFKNRWEGYISFLVNPITNLVHVYYSIYVEHLEEVVTLCNKYNQSASYDWKAKQLIEVVVLKDRSNYA